MAGNEHLMFAEEPAFGTWTTPDKALPVRTATVAPESPLLIDEATGGGRGRRDGSPGEVAVAGDLETYLYPVTVGYLLRSVLATRVKTDMATIVITSSSVANPSLITCAAPHGLTSGATILIDSHSGSTPAIDGEQIVTVVDSTTFTIPVDVTVGGTGGTMLAGYLNKLLIDDDVAHDSFSFQKRYKPTVAESVKGAKLNRFLISARTREFANLTLGWVAKDATITDVHSVVVSSSSVADPSVITCAAPHNFTTGQTITIAGHSGATPDINADHIVTVVDSLTFTIPVNVTVGGTGGTAIPEHFVTWSNGDAVPAVVDPVPYAGLIPEAFKFYQGSFILGGSVALTGGELVVTDGTSKVDFDNVEVEANFNLGTDAYGINLGDRTVQTIDEGRREIMCRFDPNFDTSPAQFYADWRAGRPAVIQLLFQGPAIDESGDPYELKVVLPNVKYATGSLPELNADYGLKRFTVEGEALLHPTLDVDIGMTIRTYEDYTA